ncbi:MAG: hypothetical protein B7X37_02645 [Halothiobacillus sp. 14-55-98]|jgi:hypothetical protein|nr:MAG: hypothetical protein B7X37_02645 [Halothiobacillus sp. 14-55-98]
MNQANNQNKTLVPRLRKIGLMAGLLFGGLGISGLAAAAPAEIVLAPGYPVGIFIGIDQGRQMPPPRHEVIGRAPFHGAIWVPGRWEWRNHWVWYRGQWGHRHHHYRERVYWAPRYPMYREGRDDRGYDGRRHDHRPDRYDDDRRDYRH